MDDWFGRYTRAFMSQGIAQGHETNKTFFSGEMEGSRRKNEYKNSFIRKKKFWEIIIQIVQIFSSKSDAFLFFILNKV